MLTRLLSAGVLLVAGVQSAWAADPLIPPPPASSSPTPIGKNVGTPSSVAEPPLPGIAPQNSLPVPEAIPSQPPAGDPLPPPNPVIEEAVPMTKVPASGKSTPIPGNSVPPTPSGSPYPEGLVTPGSIGYPQWTPGTQWNEGEMSGGHMIYGYPATWIDPYTSPQYNSFSTTPSYPQPFQSGPAGAEHARYPYYSYRRPWYSPGPVSRNVNIVW